MRKNLWTAHAAELAEAYVRDAGSVRFELVTRSLLAHLPNEPQRVVDIGGGFGQQAIRLARHGHSVVVLDIDSKMLALAGDGLSAEPPDVRARVSFVLGDGEAARRLVGTNFDAVCCHSVLMYERDPVPLLRSIVGLVRRGGLLSVLSLNPAASAMRSGLQGRWREASATLQSGAQKDSQYIQTYDHSREVVTDVLEAAGATLVRWYGIGIFTDHLTGAVVVDDPDEVYLAEWLAGDRDPYRQIARCYHLIATRE